MTKSFAMSFVAIGALLAACNAPASEAGATTDAAATPAPAAASAATNTPVSCEGFEIGDPRLAQDGCTLTGPGLTGALVVTKPGDAVRVQVIGANGTPGQLIEEESFAPYSIPTLSDLNGDQLAEVLIPKDTGNVNTNYAVFAPQPDGTYLRLGEMSGTNWEPSADGFLAVSSRGSAASIEVAFIDVEPGGLTPIATVEVTMESEGAKPVCKLVEGAPLVDQGRTTAESEAHFCADKVVTGAFE